MARAKSTYASLKGAHQLLEPGASPSAVQQHVQDKLAIAARKKMANKRRSKQSQAAKAAKARRFA